MQRRSLVSRKTGLASYQWPNNNQSTMITGIGTPTNQSRIPFPIVVSSKSFDREANARGRAGFLYGVGGSDSESPDSKQRVAVLIDSLAHFRVDVVSVAAARQPPFVFRCAGWRTRT